VIAYLFWHRPREDAASDSYERSQMAFHRSLAHRPPVGLRASALFALEGAPWLAPQGRCYEDWYLLEDFAALGVLNEAAVGRGHRSAHEQAAHGFGAGGLYALLEGELDADALARAPLAVWVARPPGSARRALGELLGDGMDPARASLWRRQLVLGPAPEFCVLAAEPPAGVAPARLPAGWSATALRREALWHG